MSETNNGNVTMATAVYDDLCDLALQHKTTRDRNAIQLREQIAAFGETVEVLVNRLKLQEKRNGYLPVDALKYVTTSMTAELDMLILSLKALTALDTQFVSVRAQAHTLRTETH